MASSSSGQARGGQQSSGNNRPPFILYFFVVILAFSVLTFVMNAKHAVPDSVATELSVMRQHLEASKKAVMAKKSQLQQEGVYTRIEKDFVEDADDKKDPENYHLAGLNCDRYGGPPAEAAQEMVYWEDIPADTQHQSPFKKTGAVQYLTFEPDAGGWNNIRMAMETVLALAFAMGRTLVLPPEQRLYLLGQSSHQHHGKQQRHKFGFNHFFHMEAIHDEHVGLDIITMKDFLEREAMTGRMRDKSGQVTFPPGNRTDWDGLQPQQVKQLYEWLRASSHMALWVPEECLAVFPSSTDPENIKELMSMKQQAALLPGRGYERYVGKPVPVNASALDRMKENWAERKDLCVYDEAMQNAPVVHFPVDGKLNARLLVHFYAFLFFQDWHQDLWMKRFIRDHVRYVDEIQCGAAKVVQAVRERVRQRNANNTKGEFDTFHVRRGDFQYKRTRVSAEKMYEQSSKVLQDGATVFIATDEKDKTFFDPLKEHYDVVFLDDFINVLGDLNSNYFGMVDQLVASRGRKFMGCWFSTFTGYINRLRGYHANRERTPGYEQGIVPSWYYALADNHDHMQSFWPVKQSFFAREFPTSWRLIDADVSR